MATARSLFVTPSKETLTRFQFNIRYIRLLFGWSGEKLAKTLDVTRQTIKNLENGDITITTVYYFALTKVFENEISRLYSDVGFDSDTVTIIEEAYLALLECDDNKINKIQTIIFTKFKSCPKRKGCITARDSIVASLKHAIGTTKEDWQKWRNTK